MRLLTCAYGPRVSRGLGPHREIGEADLLASGIAMDKAFASVNQANLQWQCLKGGEVNIVPKLRPKKIQWEDVSILGDKNLRN